MSSLYDSDSPTQLLSGCIMFRMTSLCLALAIAGTLHTAHGQATATCPASHPYAYHDGDYCCAHDTEKTYAGEAARCDGGSIGYSSTCCKSDANVRCPTMVCANHGDPLTTAGMVGTMPRFPASHLTIQIGYSACSADLTASLPAKSTRVMQMVITVISSVTPVLVVGLTPAPEQFQR